MLHSLLALSALATAFAGSWSRSNFELSWLLTPDRLSLQFNVSAT